MAKRVLLMIGTRKGVFLAQSGVERKEWSLRGPFCEAWPTNHVQYDPASGNVYAAAGDAWFGAAVWRSPDLGETWTHSSAGLAFPEGDEKKVEALWCVEPAHGALYAGVQPAALFRSDDKGESWSEVPALRNHPTAPAWIPGGAGLILHTIVPDPADEQRMWIAISAAGTFFTADGGASWEPRNAGIEMTDETGAESPACCVHHLSLVPGGEQMFQQNHVGQYRSNDGGQTWDDVNAGLPSRFGFACAVHPRDPKTWWDFPLNGDIDGRFAPGAAAAVWRTRDAGATWQDLRAGLPQEHAYVGVFRQAMATDTLDATGVYFGTSTGQVFVSANEGDSWSMIPGFLPPITSIEVAVLD